MLWGCASESGDGSAQQDDPPDSAAGADGSASFEDSADDGSDASSTDALGDGGLPNDGVSCLTDVDCSSLPPLGPCQQWACSAESGTCYELASPNGSACAHTPGSPNCRAIDICVDGECQAGAGPPADCTHLDQPCGTGICNPASGECEFLAADDGSDCSDGDACRVPSFCKRGACTGGGALECDDDSVCTIDTCDADLGCLFTPLPRDSPCSDGDPCSLDDRCIAGTCEPLAFVECDDGEPCTVEDCNATGTCSQLRMLDGATCDDGNPCTEDGYCLFGECQIEPAECVLCGEADWTPCDDGSDETTGDVCHDGVCAGFGKKKFLWNNAESTRFEALVASDVSMFGLGDAVGADSSFAAAAQVFGGSTGGGFSSLAGSVILEDEYVAAHHGLAVTSAGAVRSVEAATLETADELAAAMAELPAAEAISSVWGTTLYAGPAADDVWYFAGETTSEAPWLARCTHLGDPEADEPPWTCDALTEIPDGFGPARAIYGQTGPCTEPGCAGNKVAKVWVFASAQDTGLPHVLTLEEGTWQTSPTLAGDAANEWRAAHGGNSAPVWAVGHGGLVAVFGSTGWKPIELTGGPPVGDVQLNDVVVDSGRVFAAGTHTYEVFGKPVTSSYLITWNADSETDEIAATWIEVAESVCSPGGCIEGEFDLGGAVRAVRIGGTPGSHFGIYLAGYETILNETTGVIYFHPL